jgi:hypothetical protein
MIALSSIGPHSIQRLPLLADLWFPVQG